MTRPVPHLRPPVEPGPSPVGRGSGLSASCRPEGANRLRPALFDLARRILAGAATERDVRAYVNGGER